MQEVQEITWGLKSRAQEQEEQKKFILNSISGYFFGSSNASASFLRFFGLISRRGPLFWVTMKLQIKIRKIIDFGEIRSGWIISHALLSPMVLSEVANKILAWWLSFWKASWEFFENSRISRISRKSSICVISSECSNGLVTSMRSCACFRIPKNPWRSEVVPVRSWLLVLKIMFCARAAGSVMHMVL